MGAALLCAHRDWFALPSPALPREGTAGWKCPLLLCLGYGAVSHSARRKQLAKAQGMGSVPAAQLCAAAQHRIFAFFS